VQFPIIDLDAEYGVSSRIDRACREVGFFAIVGHGVPQGVIDDAWSASTRFFDRPTAMIGAYAATLTCTLDTSSPPQILTRPVLSVLTNTTTRRVREDGSGSGDTRCVAVGDHDCALMTMRIGSQQPAQLAQN